MNKQKEKLAITLFKPKVHTLQECLSDYEIEKRATIKPQFELEGEVLIGAPPPIPLVPEWLNFLQEGVNEKLPDLENKSSRAAIIVKVKERFVGVSFGYGQVLFDKTKIERNFGLKTVINSVDPDNLRSFNSTKLDDNTIITRKQASRGSKRSAFGSDLPSELLCGVSGKCLESVLGAQISGTDQLLISPRVDFTNLKEVLETALAQYFKKDYQKNFAWFDNIQIENDTEKCEQLCADLTKELQSGKFEQLSMACPDIYDPEKIGGFSFTLKGDLHSDLYFEEFMAYLKESKGASLISVDDLKSHKIWVKDTQEEEVGKWSAFDCLIYETELDNVRYVLFKGEWYHIDKEYLDVLHRYFDTKTQKGPETCSITLEDHCDGDKESLYNAKIGSQDDCLCLDQKLIRLKGLDPIESCDILTSKGEFLHIKKKYDSAALSHLFAQGKVAGELLISSEGFRKELRKKIRQVGRGKINDSLIPLGKVKSGDFKIVFGVIDKKDDDNLNLPFFSLVNFHSTGRYLETLGFEVIITKIKCKAA